MLFINYLTCGYGVYYFIALIMECYILTPILIKHRTIESLIVVIVLSVLTTAGFEWLRFVNGVSLPLNVYGSFPPLLIFYYLGIYFSNRDRDYSLWIPLGLIALGLAIGIMQGQFLYNRFGIGAFGQKLGLYPFDCGVILLCLNSKIERTFRTNRFTRLILAIGEMSFAIYFTHVYFIWLADIFCPTLHTHWLLLWTLSSIATIFAVGLAKCLLPSAFHHSFAIR